MEGGRAIFWNKLELKMESLCLNSILSHQKRGGQNRELTVERPLTPQDVYEVSYVGDETTRALTNFSENPR